MNVFEVKRAAKLANEAMSGGSGGTGDSGGYMSHYALSTPLHLAQDVVLSEEENYDLMLANRSFIEEMRPKTISVYIEEFGAFYTFNVTTAGDSITGHHTSLSGCESVDIIWLAIETVNNNAIARLYLTMIPATVFYPDNPLPME